MGEAKAFRGGARPSDREHVPVENGKNKNSSKADFARFPRGLPTCTVLLLFDIQHRCNLPTTVNKTSAWEVVSRTICFGTSESTSQPGSYRPRRSTTPSQTSTTAWFRSITIFEASTFVHLRGASRRMLSPCPFCASSVSGILWSAAAGSTDSVAGTPGFCGSGLAPNSRR